MIHCAIDSGGEARPTVHRTRPGDPAVTIFIRSSNSSGLLRYSAAVWNVNKATPKEIAHGFLAANGLLSK